MRAPRRRAFTLLELLTVIAIISTLMSLLLPSMAGARRQGMVAKCETNIRELDQATLRYLSQHDDVFPVAADCNDSQCGYWNGHQYFGWNGRMASPLDRVWYRPVNRELSLEPSPAEPSVAKIAQCPSDAGAPGETGTDTRLFDALGTSYPLNPILCQGRYSTWKYRDIDLGLSQIIQPSLKVLVFDHPAFGLTFDGYWTAIRPGWHDPFRPTAVVGFIDGHAEAVKGLGSIKEWQWYGEASGPQYAAQLTKKVNWQILPGSEQ
jgi:prepilin-type N-terminal cleavage/methylation domain-containing protein